MSLFSRLFLLACISVLSACGGRVARPTAVETDFDHQLSCAHLEAEFDVNKRKLIAVGDERSDKVGYNIGIVLVSPLFFDFSGSEKQEIEALYQRNNRLAQLAKEKGCIPEEDAMEAS